MKDIDKIRVALENGEISIEHAQANLVSALYSYSEELDLLIPVETNKFEREVNHFDNELELVIYTLNRENQLAAAIKVINEASQFIKEKLIRRLLRSRRLVQTL